ARKIRKSRRKNLRPTSRALLSQSESTSLERDQDSGIAVSEATRMAAGAWRRAPELTRLRKGCGERGQHARCQCATLATSRSDVIFRGFFLTPVTSPSAPPAGSVASTASTTQTDAACCCGLHGSRAYGSDKQTSRTACWRRSIRRQAL